MTRLHPINHIIPYLLSGLTIAHIPISYHVPIRIPSKNTKTWLIKSIMWLFFCLNKLNKSPRITILGFLVGLCWFYPPLLGDFLVLSPGIPRNPQESPSPGSTAQLQAKVRTKGGGSRQHRTQKRRKLGGGCCGQLLWWITMNLLINSNDHY